MKKFFTLVMALFAISLVSIGFVACSGDDDDEASVVATFYTTPDTDGDYTLLNFYSDDTWKMTYYGFSDHGDYTLLSGDWTNGKVMMTMDSDMKTILLPTTDIVNGEFSITDVRPRNFIKK